MKVYKYISSCGRENAIILDKVVHVHMSSTLGWVTLQGSDGKVKVSKSQAERMIKLLEESCD